jgi:hypothetical protein
LFRDFLLHFSTLEQACRVISNHTNAGQTARLGAKMVQKALSDLAIANLKTEGFSTGSANDIGNEMKRACNSSPMHD